MGEKDLGNTVFSEIHSELLMYLEDKVVNNTATYNELIAYEEYKVLDTFDIDSEVFEGLLIEMEEIYIHGYK